MEFRREALSLQEAKQIGLVAYLCRIGHQPVKIKGHSYWYLSPLRDEKTASFKVNTRLNRWYDFGLGKGGSILDFCMLYMNLSLTEAVRILSGPTFPSAPPSIDKSMPADKQSTIAVIQNFEVTSAPLTDYLGKRGIFLKTAAKYCREIRYQAGEKIYYGIGFQNDSGGWEIRNAYFKGSASPKDLTTIRNGHQRVSVFEGFFDFLTYVEIAGILRLPATDFIILNSLAFAGIASTLLSAYTAVDLYLDNDAAGKNVSRSLRAMASSYTDQSYRYASNKDLNEFWIGSGRDTAAFCDIHLRPP